MATSEKLAAAKAELQQKLKELEKQHKEALAKEAAKKKIEDDKRRLKLGSLIEKALGGEVSDEKLAEFISKHKNEMTGILALDIPNEPIKSEPEVSSGSPISAAHTEPCAELEEEEIND